MDDKDIIGAGREDEDGGMASSSRWCFTGVDGLIRNVFEFPEQNVGEEDISFDSFPELLEKRLLSVCKGSSSSDSGTLGGEAAPDIDPMDVGDDYYAKKPGRLGPRVARFEASPRFGHLQIREGEEILLEAENNFPSALANVCFYQGKWMYEVTLGSVGVMQIGWAILGTPFTHTEGIGDFRYSYAYDGKRVKKWNVEDEKYGDAWATSDVIGCCLDLDAGEVSFYRNGNPLGVAFSDLPIHRKGFALFPGLSLSRTERCAVNFGGLPFRYPLEGFEPVQPSPAPSQCERAEYLFQSIVRAERIRMECQQHVADDDLDFLCALACTYLGPMCHEPHAVLRLVSSISSIANDSELVLHAILDRLESFLMGFEIHSFLQVTFRELARRVRTAAFSTGATGPVTYLKTVAAFFSHQFAVSVFVCLDDAFDLMEEMLSRKQMNTKDLAQLIPDSVLAPYATFEEGDDSDSLNKILMELPAFSEPQAAFSRTQTAQYRVCDLLCENTTALSTSAGVIYRPEEDSSESVTPNSPAAFFTLFVRHVFRRNRLMQHHITPVGLSDRTMTHSLFFYLIRKCENSGYLDAIIARNPLSSASDGKRKESIRSLFPLGLFKWEISDADPKGGPWPWLFEFDRLGGTLRHVSKESDAEEAFSRLPSSVSIKGNEAGVFELHGDEFPDRAHFEEIPMPSSAPRAFTEFRADAPPAPESFSFCAELFHDAILLFFLDLGMRYKHACLLQKRRASVSRDVARAKRMLDEAQAEGKEPPPELVINSLSGFVVRVIETIRQSAWTYIIMFQREQRELLLKLCTALGVVLNEAASFVELFPFIPEFYLFVFQFLFQALRLSDAPRELLVYESMQDLNTDALILLYSFSVSHFSDRRMINVENRELLLHAISKNLRNGHFARVLYPFEIKKRTLIPLLIQNYDTRFWVTITTILLRFWRGGGFLQKRPEPENPFYSVELQSIFHEALMQSEVSSKFLSHVFEKINLTLTEFTVSAKAILEQRDRPTPGRPLQSLTRHCTVMIDLFVALSRLLEFLCSDLPDLFMGTELHLIQLVETVLTVLNYGASGSQSQILDRLFHSTNLQGGESSTLTFRVLILPPCLSIINQMVLWGKNPSVRAESLSSLFAELDSKRVLLDESQPPPADDPDDDITGFGAILTMIRGEDWGVETGITAPTRLRILQTDTEGQTISEHTICAVKQSPEPVRQCEDNVPLEQFLGSPPEFFTNPFLHRLVRDPRFTASAFDYLVRFPWERYIHPNDGDSASEKLLSLRSVVAWNVLNEFALYEEKKSTDGAVEDVDLCVICYSQAVDTEFLPCGHVSCHTCIERYLSGNSRKCPFCNGEIERTQSLKS